MIHAQQVVRVTQAQSDFLVKSSAYIVNPLTNQRAASEQQVSRDSAYFSESVGKYACGASADVYASLARNTYPIGLGMVANDRVRRARHIHVLTFSNRS